MENTVIGLFDSISDAYDAIDDLKESGYSGDQISVLAYDPHGTFAKYLEANPELGEIEAEVEEEEDATEGMAVGAVLGGLGGFLIGLGALTMGPLGPVLAAGPIAAGLLSGATGAGLGAFFGAMADAGISQSRAEVYVEGVRRGGTVVIVQTSQDNVEEVEEIMDDYGAVDMDERVSDWKREGWKGFEAEASAS